MFFFAKIIITMEVDMNNITIVGMDNDFIKMFAQKLAEEIGYKYVDANEQFDEDLLANLDYPMYLVDEILVQKENLLINNLVKKEKVIISMSDDMFLSNEHYKILENSLTILILDEKLGKIKKNIQNLIKKHVKFAFDKNDIKTEDVIKIIRGLL